MQNLGRRINAAVNDLTRSATLDEKAFEAMIKEICNALVESDVNIKLVAGLRNSIKKTVNFNELAPGVNKKRIIQKVPRLLLLCYLRSSANPCIGRL